MTHCMTCGSRSDYMYIGYSFLFLKPGVIVSDPNTGSETVVPHSIVSDPNVGNESIVSPHV